MASKNTDAPSTATTLVEALASTTTESTATELIVTATANLLTATTRSRNQVHQKQGTKRKIEEISQEALEEMLQPRSKFCVFHIRSAFKKKAAMSSIQHGPQQ